MHTSASRKIFTVSRADNRKLDRFPRQAPIESIRLDIVTTIKSIAINKAIVIPVVITISARVIASANNCV